MCVSVLRSSGLERTGAQELAYSNLIQVIRAKTADGFVPNFSVGPHKTTLHSQPPVGASPSGALTQQLSDGRPCGHHVPSWVLRTACARGRSATSGTGEACEACAQVVLKVVGRVPRSPMHVLVGFEEQPFGNLGIMVRQLSDNLGSRWDYRGQLSGTVASNFSTSFGNLITHCITGL